MNDDTSPARGTDCRHGEGKGEAEGAPLNQWLPAGAKLPADVAASVERIRRAPDVVHVAVMPDVHLAREFCIGTVVATGRLIYPDAVGGDIGCGMAAVGFDCGADALADDAHAAGRLMARLYERVPANRHRRPRDLPAELERPPLSEPRLDAVRRRDARVQLGTLGRGNHFLEFQADEEGRLWLMVHSGSRAVGQAVRDLHLARASPPGRGPRWLDADSPEGRAYLADVEWARRYALANRKAMLDAAVAAAGEVLGAGAVEGSAIHCDHNHVRRERHFGTDLWVHRKGATPAAAGVAGVVPGSMGTASYHVEGRGEARSLCSAAHGAGRAMSRDEARRRVSPRDLSRQMRGVWFDRRAAERLRDEAPSAYKDVGAVMRAQRELVRVVRRLVPVLCYKGA